MQRFWHSEDAGLPEITQESFGRKTGPLGSSLILFDRLYHITHPVGIDGRSVMNSDISLITSQLQFLVCDMQMIFSDSSSNSRNSRNNSQGRN